MVNLGRYRTKCQSLTPELTEQKAGWVSDPAWMLWRRERPLVRARKPTTIPWVARSTAQSLYSGNTTSKLQSHSVLTHQYQVMGHVTISLELSSKAPFPHLLGPKSRVPNHIWGSRSGDYEECCLLDAPPQKTAFPRMINTLHFWNSKCFTPCLCYKWMTIPGVHKSPMLGHPTD